MTTLPPFNVHRVGSVEEATELLGRLGDDAVVYCGGTELLLVYRFGFADYPELVDIKPIPELRGIAAENGELRIGATVTHREIELSPIVQEHFPALVEMERHVGNVRVRNVGTIGGNLCFADPHSDPTTFLIAAGGEVSMRRGGADTRRMPVEELLRGPFETALEPGELLTAVHLPRVRPGTALVHRKMSFHERPAITVAAHVEVRDRAVSEVRLAVGSVGVSPVRVHAAEGLLAGLDAAQPDPAVLAAVGEAAAEAAEPVADANGSVEYKQQLVRVLSARCLREAATEALAA
ncbi:MAG: xanthine dehydrogenase family protein subunit M [Solirubrobacteraceae bacterium]|nr:xanthine dehydrogenase family protein subunit M [Solirubrobacteraceae bacterium]